MVKIERLMKNLHFIGGIGKKDDKGITRTAFSAEYKKASQELSKFMKEAGLEVKIDSIGNIIGRRKGKDESLPVIVVGSHLDTVLNGGLYDGVLGLIAALECIKSMDENGYNNIHTIELIAFNAEEGSELGGTFGSRAMLGHIDLEDEETLEKAKLYNLRKEDLISAIREKDRIKAFLELHIEQGGILDSNNIPIGVVESIAGITRYKVRVKGEANHAGTTPMSLRKDAMVAAAKLILKVDEIARKVGGTFVATVGVLEISPGAVNVIPGIVEFVIELRYKDQDVIDKAVEDIIEASSCIEASDFEFKELVKKTPVKLDASIIDLLSNCCIRQNTEYMVMPSGAAHDAKEYALHASTGMIFVKSIKGKSHCPEEYTMDIDIEKGTKLLYQALITLDKQL